MALVVLLGARRGADSSGSCLVRAPLGRAAVSVLMVSMLGRDASSRPTRAEEAPSREGPFFLDAASALAHVPDLHVQAVVAVPVVLRVLVLGPHGLHARGAFEPGGELLVGEPRKGGVRTATATTSDALGRSADAARNARGAGARCPLDARRGGGGKTMRPPVPALNFTSARPLQFLRRRAPPPQQEGQRSARPSPGPWRGPGAALG